VTTMIDVPKIDCREDFPSLADGWHYLDTAATALKPQAVIDAVARGYGADYATVHRGVYRRSADMTLAYEAARKAVADLMDVEADEIVFVRGATEGINLVAQSWGRAHLKAGDRILISELEHHSNIVPWQLLRDQIGIEIDVCPLTDDHGIDLDAAERILDERHKLVAFAHVSNVLGSVLDAQRAAALAHGVGAKLLLDGCQALPHGIRPTTYLKPFRPDLMSDFYVFSGHKLYGPTGIGVLWAPGHILDSMPPWHGGGAMIDRVTFEKTTYADPPQRFEAGTPPIVQAIGLHAAIRYVRTLGGAGDATQVNVAMAAVAAHEARLTRLAHEALDGINSLTIFGPRFAPSDPYGVAPSGPAGIVSFAIQGVHPHDIGTILDEEGVAIRAGHHCAQPLMRALGVDATARASFGIYSDERDVEALVKGIERVTRIFG
jgi:cysteine desulfurase / selenocysteine lyase